MRVSYNILILAGLTTATSAAATSSEQCLSPSQVKSIKGLYSSAKGDWGLIADTIKSSSTTNEKLQTANDLLDKIDSSSKQLKALNDKSACISDSDYSSISDASTGLLQTISDRIADYYSLRSDHGSKSNAKGKRSSVANSDVEHFDGQASVDAQSREYEDARRNPPYQQPYYQQAPPGYRPQYQPEYQPAYQPQPAYPPTNGQPYYPSAGQQSPNYYPAQAPNAAQPNHTPNTGGYQYQGGDSDNAQPHQQNSAYPEEQPAVYGPYGQYQQPYQPAYYPSPNYEPAPAASTNSSPNLNDHDGGFIIRFLDRITETLLYQIEVVGFEFGHHSNSVNTKSDSLLSSTEKKIKSYAAMAISSL